MRIRVPSDCAGFTLAELLVACSISLVLGAAGFLFFRTQLRTLTDQSATLDAIEGTRAAVDFMMNDIRMAGANPAGTWIPAANICGAGLSQARTNSVTLRWDGANGGAVDGTIDANETIAYTYNSGPKTITRDVNGTSTTLIKNATGLTFEYFVGTANAATSGSPAQVTNADCDRVTAIRVTVQVQTARATTVTNVNLGARVALRNRSAVLARL